MAMGKLTRSRSWSSLCPAELREIIAAHGHKNVVATHKTTLEITKETHLTKKGDCIVAVGANKAIDNLSPAFKESLRNDHARLTVLIEVGGTIETVKAIGNSHLILAHPTDIVVRKSGHITNRTLAIQADKSANELSRELVKRLKDPKQKVKITLITRA